MPSNTVKISALVAMLQQLAQQNGDLDVIIPNPAQSGAAFAIFDNQKDVVPQSSIAGVSLPYPAIVIAPSTPYSATADVTQAGVTWVYDLAQAAPDTLLKVWKRIGGQDMGVFSQGQWYVYEGGQKPLQIVPGGVLAWANYTGPSLTVGMPNVSPSN